MINKIKILTITTTILILFFLTYSIFKDKQPLVLNSDPINGQTEVDTKKQISIFFQGLSEKQKNMITYKIIPETESKKTWLNTIFKVVPIEDLKNNSEYQLIIFYKQKEIYKIDFKTQTFDNEEILKYGKLQSENDYLFGQEQIKFLKKYPFYTYMPLKNSKYIVDYLDNENKFKITLLSIFTDKEIEAFKNEAKTELLKIGVKEPINFVIEK